MIGVTISEWVEATNDDGETSGELWEREERKRKRLKKEKQTHQKVFLDTEYGDQGMIL